VPRRLAKERKKKGQESLKDWSIQERCTSGRSEEEVEEEDIEAGSAMKSGVDEDDSEEAEDGTFVFCSTSFLSERLSRFRRFL
jgi:hypothetical protein